MKAKKAKIGRLGLVKFEKPSWEISALTAGLSPRPNNISKLLKDNLLNIEAFRAAYTSKQKALRDAALDEASRRRTIAQPAPEDPAH